MIQEQIQRSMGKSSQQTRELARQLGKLTQAQAALGWAVVLIVLTLTGVIYLRQTSRIAAVGRNVQELQANLTLLRLENSAIEKEIAQGQTLERLQSKATELGFVSSQTENIDYLIIPNYPADVPQHTQSATTPRARAVPVESMTEALTISLQNSFDELVEGVSSE